MKIKKNFKKIKSERSLLYYTLNFGPQHPAAHGVLRLILTLIGETLIDADPHIGLLHRGTEKLLEGKTFLQGMPYFARLDYVASMSQEHVFCLAIELLNDIYVPKRYSYIRLVFLELSRILNHILAVTTHALDVGAMTPFLWCFEEREKIMEFCERVSGARMHTSFFRFGGTYCDLSKSLLKDMKSFTKKFRLRLNETQRLITKSRIWQQRLGLIGVVNYKHALTYAFSGPLLRSVGFNWDLRKHQIYENYENVDFFIPMGHNGDSFDRFMIRMFEMEQSINIVEQSLNWLLKNNFIWINQHDEENDIDPKITFNFKNISKYSMEGLISHFKLYSEGFTIEPDEDYIAGEAPKGEFGVYLETDGTNKPHRVKIRAPGFFHLQAFNYMAKKHLLADAVTVVGTQDIVFGEIDR